MTNNKKFGTCKLKVAMAVADTAATADSVAKKLGAARHRVRSAPCPSPARPRSSPAPRPGSAAATAELLAARGARVLVAGLQPERLRETVAAITADGGEAIAVEADVSDPAQIEAVAARAQEAFGGADVLVNNAAIYPIGPWHEADAAEWDAVFATNVRGYFLLAKAVRPQMLARGGGVDRQRRLGHVLLGRGGARSPTSRPRARSIGFTRSLAREAGPEGIRVNAVAPGAFPTAATAIHADQDALWSGVLEAQSIKRRGEVEDVARAIAFFAGEDSGFVSGQTLLVDGGWMRD